MNIDELRDFAVRGRMLQMAVTVQENGADPDPMQHYLISRVLTVRDCSLHNKSWPVTLITDLIGTGSYT